MKPNDKYHVCCGQRKRLRASENGWIPQPHQCNESRDVAGIDWTAVKAEVNPQQKERI